MRFVQRHSPLTESGTSLALLFAASYVAGWLLGWTEMTVIAGACATALLVASLFVLSQHRLTVQRRLSNERVSVGDSATSTLVITNSSSAPSLANIVEEVIDGVPHSIDVTTLRPGRTREEVIELPTERRGVIQIGPTIVAKRDPLGLLQRQVRQTAVDQLWVHPRTVGLAGMTRGVSKDLEGATSDASPAGDVSFHTLRPYELGDDPRHVHWLSTARTGSLMVRHYVDSRLPHLTVVLDDSQPTYSSEAFETAMEVTASLAVNALTQQLPCAVQVGNEGAVGGTNESPSALLDRLATVVASVGCDLDAAVSAALLARPQTSALVIVTGARPALELLPLIRPADRSVFVIRVWEAEAGIDPIVLPGTTVLDITSLDQFRVAWDRRSR